MKLKLSYNRLRLVLRMSRQYSFTMKYFGKQMLECDLATCNITSVLDALQKGGIIETIERGKYQLTADGYRAVTQIEKDIDYANSSN